MYAIFMDEKTIEFLEEHIPEMAEAAVTEAYWDALASAHKVLEVDGDHLVETSPDGTKKVIKTLPPRKRVKKGQKLIIE